MNNDILVLIFDSAGVRGTSYSLGWDVVTNRDSYEVVRRLSVMNDIAQIHIVNASKDVSMAGMIGTAGMLVEYSGTGGVIDIDAIDASRPSSVPLEDWIRMYISLGFLVSLPLRNLKQLTTIAQEHGLSAVRIGVVDDSSSFRLKLGNDEQILFDFSKGPVLTPKNTNK